MAQVQILNCNNISEALLTIETEYHIWCERNRKVYNGKGNC